MRAQVEIIRLACGQQTVMTTKNGGDEESVFYAFFSCKCKGIKFYDLREAGLEFWQHVTFVREPSNPQDCNAVMVCTVSRNGKELKIGHIEKEAAEWLSSLLLGPFCIYN